MHSVYNKGDQDNLFQCISSNVTTNSTLHLSATNIPPIKIASHDRERERKRARENRKICHMSWKEKKRRVNAPTIFAKLKAKFCNFCSQTQTPLYEVCFIFILIL